MFKFSEKSIQLLNAVDKRLGVLAREVIKISPYNFCITCGLRSQEEQQAIFKSSKGKTLCDGIKNKSKHQSGKAIDIMCFDGNGKGTWERKYYIAVTDVFKQKAEELKIDIKWGGEFKSIVDCPHFELII